MIDFINFITMLVWAFTKLGITILLFCVTLLCLKPTLKETAGLVAECMENFKGCWEEIKIMERAEYGD